MNFKKIVSTIFVFIIVVISISCNIELRPFGHNLKILSHNMPEYVLEPIAEPIVIKFSEPLMAEYSKRFLILIYIPFVVEDQFLSSYEIDKKAKKDSKNYFTIEFSKNKTEMIITKNYGYYPPNSQLTIDLAKIRSISG